MNSQVVIMVSDDRMCRLHVDFLSIREVVKSLNRVHTTHVCSLNRPSTFGDEMLGWILHICGGILVTESYIGHL